MVVPLLLLVGRSGPVFAATAPPAASLSYSGGICAADARCRQRRDEVRMDRRRMVVVAVPAPPVGLGRRGAVDGRLIIIVMLLLG